MPPPCRSHARDSRRLPLGAPSRTREDQMHRSRFARADTKPGFRCSECRRRRRSALGSPDLGKPAGPRSPSQHVDPRGSEGLGRAPQKAPRPSSRGTGGAACPAMRRGADRSDADIPRQKTKPRREASCDPGRSAGSQSHAVHTSIAAPVEGRLCMTATSRCLRRCPGSPSIIHRSGAIGLGMPKAI
jgi:hypothetical protein